MRGKPSVYDRRTQLARAAEEQAQIAPGADVTLDAQGNVVPSPLTNPVSVPGAGVVTPPVGEPVGPPNLSQEDARKLAAQGPQQGKPAPGAGRGAGGGYVDEFGNFQKELRSSQERKEAGLDAQNEQNQKRAELAKLTANQLRFQSGLDEQELKEKEGAFAKVQAQYDTDKKAMDTEYRRAVKEYQDAKVDPGRIWADPGRSAGMIFSAVLGALGQGLQNYGSRGQANAPNLALQAIDRAIDRDIDAQKSNIQKMGSAVEMKRNQMGDLRQAFGDDRAVFAMARENMISDAQRKLNGMREQYTFLDKSKEFEQIQAGLQVRKEESHQQFLMASEGIAKDRAGIALQREQLALSKKAMAAQAEINSTAGLFGGTPDSPKYVATHQLQRGQDTLVREKLDKIERAKGIVQQMNALGDFGVTDKIFNTDKAEKYEALRAQLAGVLGKDQANAFARADKFFENPEATRATNARFLQDEENSIAKNFGLVPVGGNAQGVK